MIAVLVMTVEIQVQWLWIWMTKCFAASQVRDAPTNVAAITTAGTV